MREVVEECARLGVGYLTLFAFSRENWRRPQDEVGALMSLLEQYLKKELGTLMKNDVRLLTIGNLQDIPGQVRKTLEEVVEVSAANGGLTLILALSYGSRQEIVDAARKLAGDVAGGRCGIDDITEESLGANLSTGDLPDPDLLIRTSGEMRVSNFLLWQIAYSELYVTEKLWPDFTADDLRKAIEDYTGRERRFGMTSEQVRIDRK